MLHNSKLKKNIFGTLYVVATPIGNINDISYRAIDILSKVDLIAAEDTRHSRKILTNFGINTKVISYHKYNEYEKCDQILDLIIKGKNIALISDAGTPGISDPGDIIVSKAHKKNINVSPIPGASSVISALSVSGFASKDFKFTGFLPKKQNQKIEFLKKNINKNYSLVFFESPKRVIKTLEDLKNIYNGKEIIITREITKIYEDIGIDSIDNWIDLYRNNQEKIKGEFVFIIPRIEQKKNTLSDNEIEDFLQLLLQNSISYKSAVQITSKYFDLNKNKIYKKHMYLAKD
ncbi:MAG: 16S rRNA (cytidine(1402)-2'-O)-methyltransferase [Gammaproteobacteria bacterium]|nr:16S rRNA (cytidine(1402)-2'-O)-methyltransferase [Gammaproteobacteria bacterium]